MGWLGHVAHMGKMRNVFKIWSKTYREENAWKTYVWMIRIIILKCMLKRWDIKMHNGFIRLRAWNTGKVL
jgi:hypothetical protein